jgi:hypothetical protein
MKNTLGAVLLSHARLWQHHSAAKRASCELPTERNVNRHERDDNTKMQNSKPHIFLVSILALLIAGLGGGVMVIRQRQVRVGAEEGIRREIRENYEGVQEVRAAIPTEVQNISGTVALLEQKETGHAVDGSKAKIGLAVLSLTNANWQAASVTGAIGTVDYATVERFAGAYFEQARLAQLQTSTMESMMSLSSYVGHGEKIQAMSPAEARTAEIQAQALLAHLKMMLRMTDGLEGAYKTALGS